MSQPFIKDSEGKFLLIRHGETAYNSACKTVLHNIGEMQSHEIRWDESYLDCRLNENGILQAEDLGKRIANLKIVKVFTSPLRRCLETTIHSLKNHPDKENLVIIINPIITELIHTIHDGSISINEKQDFYSDVTNNYGLKINWDLVVDSKYNYPYITSLDAKDDMSFSEIIKYSFEKGKRTENLPHGFKRTLELKSLLSQLVDNNSNEKILIYSHSGFIMLSTLPKHYQFGSDTENPDFPEGTYYPQNCEIISLYPDN